MNKSLPAMAALALIAAAVHARLPAPSDEAKAATAAAKDKAVWGDKVAAYQLCLAQDKVALRYLKSKDAKDGKKLTVEVPPCTNPGPYVAAAAALSGTGAVPAAPAAASAAAPAAPAKK